MKEPLLIRLRKELEPFKNTLVIGSFDNIVRLVDVIDGGDDYYWVYDSRTGITNVSCCGKWVALKGFIPDKKYNKLVDVWNLNNIERAL